MQRRLTGKTRGANADEKRFHAFCKEHRCASCGHPGPSIVDHVHGSTFRHLKVLIGHWFTIPLCLHCDRSVLKGGKEAVRERAGKTFAQMWLETIAAFVKAGNSEPPQDVSDAILDWNR